MPAASIGWALLTVTRLADFGTGFGEHLFMGDQFASVRFLHPVLDVRYLPGLEVQILVYGIADHPVAGAVQYLGQGIKLALLFRGNTDGKDTLCHAAENTRTIPWMTG